MPLILTGEKMLNRELLSQFILFLSLIILSSSTLADCEFRDDTSTGYFFLSIPALRLPKNPAPDTVLWDSGIVHPTPTPHITCLTEQVVYSGFMTAKTLVTGIATPYVYQTNNPGIGIQVMTSHDKVNTLYMMWPRLIEQAHARYEYNQENYFHVKLIATGRPLTSGYLELGGYDVDRTFGSARQYFLEFDPANIFVQSTGCDLETKDINVPLTPGRGLVITAFAGNGSTSSPVDFNINLRCEINTNINIIFNGNTPNGQKNVLLPDNTYNVSSAQGLGVQILKDGQPINFNEQKEMVHSAATEQITLPFRARLIQIVDTLRAGDVNATTTFDMVYH